MTLEVGLVSTRTYRAFTVLVSPLSKQRSCASQFLKLLLAVRSLSSSPTNRKHGSGLNYCTSATKAEEHAEVQMPSKRRVQEIKFETVEPAIDVLRKNDISVLYHFTDAANLESIREHGLLHRALINNLLRQ